jgi:hypothetical protein
LKLNLTYSQVISIDHSIADILIESSLNEGASTTQKNLKVLLISTIFSSINVFKFSLLALKYIFCVSITD